MPLEVEIVPLADKHEAMPSIAADQHTGDRLNGEGNWTPIEYGSDASSREGRSLTTQN